MEIENIFYFYMLQRGFVFLYKYIACICDVVVYSQKVMSGLPFATLMED